MRPYAVLLILSAFFVFAQKPAQGHRTPAQKFSITIVREFSDANGTYGHMEVNGVEVVKTAEDKSVQVGDGQTVKDVSLLYQSGRGHVAGPFGTYGNTGDFLLQWDANGHKYLQIHTGNSPRDNSSGCVLVGTSFQRNFAGAHGVYPVALKGSRDAIAKLRQVFYGSDNPNSTPAVDISISFTHGAPSADDAAIFTPQPAPTARGRGALPATTDGKGLNASGLVPGPGHPVGPPPALAPSAPGTHAPPTVPVGGPPTTGTGTVAAPSGGISTDDTNKGKEPPDGGVSCGGHPNSDEPVHGCKLP
jgi:hypothetical protein